MCSGVSAHSSLRKNRSPEDLIRPRLGHVDKTDTDGYSKLREDVKY